ncbi:MAG: hypothetical protein A4E72_01419 [Syntrophus sp. PtaU1.Bin208]|nr:MAG: hypothetical protein A4E72_01419 [Syntrophus sp. PtaU1.Bin208]
MQQFADRTDAAIAQMVDVVLLANAVFQADQVADRSHDVLDRQVLGHQIVIMGQQQVFQRGDRVVAGLGFIDEIAQDAGADLLDHAESHHIQVADLLGGEEAADIVVGIDPVVADDLDLC